MLSTNKINFLRQRELLKWNTFDMRESTDTIGSMSTATVVPAEHDNDDVGGLDMGSANDKVATLIAIPTHWDRDQHIRFKVVYIPNTTGSPDFAVKYTPLTANTTAMSVASSGTALDTVIPTDTIIVADTLHKTEEGILNGGTLGNAVDYLMLSVDITTGITSTLFVGLEVEFTPKYYKGYQGPAGPWSNV